MIDVETASHVSSEAGCVDPAEVSQMRERITRGELTMLRVLEWLAATRPFADDHDPRPREVRVTEDGRYSSCETGAGDVSGVGRRKLEGHRQLPVGDFRPPVGARVEVEFTDMVYTGTVRRHTHTHVYRCLTNPPRLLPYYPCVSPLRAQVKYHSGKVLFAVHFDADGETTVLRSGLNRYARIGDTAGVEGPGHTASLPSDEHELAKSRRRRGEGTQGKQELLQQQPEAHSSGVVETSSTTSTPVCSTTAAAAAASDDRSDAEMTTGSAPSSSDASAAAQATDKEQRIDRLPWSQDTQDVVSGVKSDLEQSLAMIGNFLSADVGHNEGAC
eukprot:COSAG01_NODE_65_length_29252_cov_173.296995_16_plen_330_part_00